MIKITSARILAEKVWLSRCIVGDLLQGRPSLRVALQAEARNQNCIDLRQIGQSMTAPAAALLQAAAPTDDVI